ncbi:MAG: hypothetical protein ACR2OX_09030, partial [Methyloligellaceae bacterium]
MSDTATTLDNVTAPESRNAGWLAGLFMRSEILRGYTLLSPTLIVMAVGILVPFTILLIMSFWTQHA